MSYWDVFLVQGEGLSFFVNSQDVVRAQWLSKSSCHVTAWNFFFLDVG